MPTIQALKKKHPEKFVSEDEIFGNIHRGDRIFISTGCGEPQYLVGALIRYVESHPKAVFDAEVFQVWTLGVAPYTDDKFKQNFRHNSFFIGNDTRGAINRGAADYTPIFLSQVPGLLDRRMIPVDVALVQVSVPDEHGYVSLGVSVDIVKSAVANATTVIAQVNARMPRVHGDGFVHADAIDYMIVHDEELLVYEDTTPDEIAHAVGRYVARIVRDGDTIQVGYGSLPNAIIANLENKEHLGVHTELLTDGITKLMQKGVIDNSKKTINRGKTVTTFCMGRRETYDFINDNPSIEFRTVDYTNDPLVIAQHRNMVAINSALAVDLTGQATSESIGTTFYSGIGGQADFMRGAILSPGGRTILALASTAEGGKVSRIVPFLREGEGVTLNRGDIHYVVTEWGIAYLHGKNIRERAMELIAVAHPDFRPKLIEEARRLSLIYKDQAFIPGKEGQYPEHLEAYRTTGEGTGLFMRPVKISDEGLLKDFFYDLSDTSIYRRFFIYLISMPHEKLQKFVVIDHTRETVILATIQDEGREVIVGMGQYIIDRLSLTAEVAFLVRDSYQNRGIGTELLKYLMYLAKKQGLLGFTAEVLPENTPMLHVFEESGFELTRKSLGGVMILKHSFS
jgi:acyl-CoA hydrolase/GNAT superfamily N-acetyltransferase